MINEIYYIWLSLRAGAGNEKASLALAALGSAENVYRADKAALDAVFPDDSAFVKALLDKDTELCEKIYEYCIRNGVGILTPESGKYPNRLRTIYAKPIVLYYKGKLPDIDDNALIACVGTRKCTEKGMRMAYKLGAELSAAGAIVVSGMALGIDAMCARGALSVKKPTIAVLGCGIDRVYPPENKELMAQIIKNGAVITEYIPGTPPNGAHFPVRNRIISGLSLGTVVVEADKYSGALITAEHAKKQGRDVFAFPGDIENPSYNGTNELIGAGALMVRDAKDILGEYASLWHERIFIENIRKNKYYTDKPSKLEYIKTEKNEGFIPDDAKIFEAAIAAPVSVPDEIREEHTVDTREGEDDIPANEERSFFKVFTEKMSISKLRADGKKQKNQVEDKSEGVAPRNDAEKILASLEGIEALVYKNLTGTSSSDDIAARIKHETGENVDVGEILVALTTLEISGYCCELPGGLFVRT